jgi:hypothetical protein
LLLLLLLLLLTFRFLLQFLKLDKVKKGFDDSVRLQIQNTWKVKKTSRG